MEARKVIPSNGWLWIKQGYWSFKKSPILWMVLVSIAFAGMIGITAIPVAGDALITLLAPPLLAGFMFGCRALEREEELELAHLFSGFQKHTQHLVTLGGINLVGQLLILGAMRLTGGADLVVVLMEGSYVEDFTVLSQAVANAGAAPLIGIALFSILLMAMQFAPMLVIFNNMAPIQALESSLRAFLRNVMPMTVYAAMLMPLAFMATVAMMLGWFVLLPVFIASMYAAYHDLFPTEIVETTTTEDKAVGLDDRAHF